MDFLDDAKWGQVRASIKTKWWKRAHSVMASAVSQVAMDSMGLNNRPKSAAYCEAWNDHTIKAIRTMAINWRTSPAWSQETVANNEHEIDKLLETRQFTEKYLRSSGKV